MTTKDGKSRRFAFIGFRTETQATEAQLHFNNTFVGMSKISVEMAKKFNDQSLQEQKKKHSAGQKHFSATENNCEADTKLPKVKTPINQNSLTDVDSTSVAGRKKAEFLEMMKSRKNTNKWANDDVIGSKLNQDKIEVLNSKDTISNSNDLKGDSDSDSDDDESVINEVAVETDTKKTPLSDLEYLRSKVQRDFSDSDSDDESKSEDSSDDDGMNRTAKIMKPGHSTTEMQSSTDDEHSVEDTKEEHMVSDDEKDDNNNNNVDTDLVKNGQFDDTDEIAEEDNSRLFVKNLPFTCTEAEFTELFTGFGPISEVHLPIDEEKRGKGYGFIQFMLPEHARAARLQLSGEAFQGRVLYVVHAEKQRSKETTAAEAAMLSGRSNSNSSKLSSFQQKKEEERRKFVNRKEGWNAAYVRSDTVVDSLAAK